MNRLDSKKSNIIFWMAIGLIAILYLIFILLYYKCPFNYLFGLSCPGCGLTRAYYALFRFDLSEAFHFHPLFFLYPLVLVFFIVSKILKWNIKTKYWIMIAVGIYALTIIVYLIRLSLNNDIVYFHPEEGLLTKHLFE